MAVSGATTSEAVALLSCSAYQRSASGTPLPGWNFSSCGILPCSNASDKVRGGWAGVWQSSTAQWRWADSAAQTSTEAVASAHTPRRRASARRSSAMPMATAAAAKPTP